MVIVMVMMVIVMMVVLMIEIVMVAIETCFLLKKKRVPIITTAP